MENNLDKFVDYFSKSCFSTSHIDVSNFHLQDAINYYEMIRDLLIQKFDSKPFLLSHIATPREVIIPEGKHLCPSVFFSEIWYMNYIYRLWAVHSAKSWQTSLW